MTSGGRWERQIRKLFICAWLCDGGCCSGLDLHCRRRGVLLHSPRKSMRKVVTVHGFQRMNLGQNIHTGNVLSTFIHTYSWCRTLQTLTLFYTKKQNILEQTFWIVTIFLIYSFTLHVSSSLPHCALLTWLLSITYPNIIVYLSCCSVELFVLVRVVAAAHYVRGWGGSLFMTLLTAV